VEAAGVEFEIRVIDNFLMTRDFWVQFVETAAIAAIRWLLQRALLSSIFDPISGGILEAAGHSSRCQLSGELPDASRGALKDGSMEAASTVPSVRAFLAGRGAITGAGACRCPANLKRLQRCQKYRVPAARGVSERTSDVWSVTSVSIP